MLDLVPKEDNPRDLYAVKVMVPLLENIAQEWRDREEGGTRVQDMADLTVGRMPRHLCNVVSIGMRIHHSISHATCFVNSSRRPGCWWRPSVEGHIFSGTRATG